MVEIFVSIVAAPGINDYQKFHTENAKNQGL
jgi:hypothetical protein